MDTEAVPEKMPPSMSPDSRRSRYMRDDEEMEMMMRKDMVMHTSSPYNIAHTT